MLITAILYSSVTRFRNMHFGTDGNKVVQITNTRINIKGSSDSLPVSVSITSSNKGTILLHLGYGVVSESLSCPLCYVTNDEHYLRQYSENIYRWNMFCRGFSSQIGYFHFKIWRLLLVFVNEIMRRVCEIYTDGHETVFISMECTRN